MDFLTVMDEQRRITSNSDKVTISESFVRCVTGSRCIAEAGTTAGHMIQGMLLLLLLLIGTLLVLTCIIMIMLGLVGLMIILRIGATTQTGGIILTLAAT